MPGILDRPSRGFAAARGWLVRGWLHRPSPVVLASVRGAVGVGLPLFVGVLSGHRVVGMLVGLGAVWAVNQDGVDPFVRRSARLAAVAGASSLGLILGVLVFRHADTPVPTWALLTVVAFAAGVLETGPPVAAAGGMHLILGAVIGVGLPVPGPWFTSALWVFVGVLFVLLLGWLSDPVSRLTGRRRQVAVVFRALAVLLRRLGTVDAGSARLAVVVALNDAHDAVSPLLRRPEDRDTEAGAVLNAFDAAVELGEASGVLLRRGAPVPPAFPEALDAVAEHLASRRALGSLAQQWASHGAALTEAAQPGDPAQPADPALLAILTALNPQRLKTRPRLARLRMRAPVPLRERGRFAALLAGSVLLAAVLAHLLHGPRAYWLPLSVAFIFRPDLGAVLPRAVGRTVGTAFGVALSALITFWVHDGYGLLAFAVLCAALIPVAARRGHGVTVVVFTPIVFVFLGLIGQNHDVLLTRIVDTSVAALIVLVADFVVWSQPPSVRVEARVARAEALAAEYARAGPDADPVARHCLRRETLRALSEARASLAAAAGEKRRDRQSAPDVELRLAEVERRSDAVTESLVRAHHST